MLRPNQICYIVKSQGNDVYGRPLPGKRLRERCSVVKLIVNDEKSAVRTDSSASKGNAQEFVAESVILLTPQTTATIHDILEVRGVTLEIMGMHQRFNVQGVLDHFEVTGKIWTK